MKNKHNSIMVKLFTLIMAMFLSVTLLGCNDTIVADMEAEHLRLGTIAKQDLRRNMSAFPATPQEKVFYPAP